MRERVEEITRKYAAELCILAKSPELRAEEGQGWREIGDIADLLAALAQAEREREIIERAVVRRDELAVEARKDYDAIRKERDGARAEVERLKDEREKYIADVTYACGRAVEAEAALARVRAALKEMVDCCQYPEHDDSRLDYITVQVDRDTLAEARAALEGRG